jgi:subtilase family serine protease
MMAMSPGSPTRYLHQHASIGVWISNLADTVNIPWVLSVSYGAYEDTTSAQEMNTFTRAAIRMGIMGVTIVVASGDYGAGDTHYDRKTCRYGPFFPASSPYVISVGATKVITLIDILYRVFFGRFVDFLLFGL